MHYFFVIYKINENFHSHPCVFFACLGKKRNLSTWYVFRMLRSINTAKSCYMLSSKAHDYM